MTLLSPGDRLKVGTRRIVKKVYRQPLDTLEDFGDPSLPRGRLPELLA